MFSSPSSARTASSEMKTHVLDAQLREDRVIAAHKVVGRAGESPQRRVHCSDPRVVRSYVWPPEAEPREVLVCARVHRLRGRLDVGQKATGPEHESTLDDELAE